MDLSDKQSNTVSIALTPFATGWRCGSGMHFYGHQHSSGPRESARAKATHNPLSPVAAEASANHQVRSGSMFVSRPVSFRVTTSALSPAVWGRSASGCPPSGKTSTVQQTNSVVGVTP